MLSLNDFQSILANSFLDGNIEIAGIIMFAAVLLVVLALTKDTFRALLVGIVATMVFSLLGILSTELTILLIIVSVLGMAYSARAIWRD